MKWTIAGLILVGIAASLSAALLAASLRAGGTRGLAVQASLEEREILVVTRDLPAMSVVDAKSVAMQKVKADEAPPDALTNVVQVVGQVLISPLVEGQAFRRGHFASDGSNVHLASALPEGARAMSIMLNESSGIASLLYPGSIVDVVASFRLPTLRGNRGGDVISATLLQGVQVLAVGPRSIVSERGEGEVPDANSRRGRMVTLMVDPAQAEALQLAMVYGTVSLALRNPLDNSEAEGAGVLMSDLSEEIARRIAAVAEINTARAPLALDEVSGRGEGETEAPPAAPAAATSAVPRGGMRAPGDPVIVPEDVPVWTTVLLRGSRSQTLTFPVEEDGSEDEADG
ncbi:MAG: Flp pilus assembly protein CpaB [Planctomycetota bacterium]